MLCTQPITTADIYLFFFLKNNSIYMVNSCICMVYSRIWLVCSHVCAVYSCICIVYSHICMVYSFFCMVFSCICILYSCICKVYSCILMHTYTAFIGIILANYYFQRVNEEPILWIFFLFLFHEKGYKNSISSYFTCHLLVEYLNILLQYLTIVYKSQVLILFKYIYNSYTIWEIVLLFNCNFSSIQWKKICIKFCYLLIHQL